MRASLHQSRHAGGEQASISLFVSKGKRLADVLLALYAAAALLALSLPLGPWVQGFKRLLAYSLMPGFERGSAALEAFSGVSANWSRLLKADLENRELRERLDGAALQEEEAKSVLAEDAHLRDLLSLRARTAWRFQTARVVERDPAAWYSSVVVDKGEAAGVRAGAAAFTMERGRLVLAGRVVEASSETARVLLVTDDLSAVAALVAPGGWQGLVEGQGPRDLRMNFLPAEALPRVGDEVLTSPVSPTFPPNVLIGTVSRVLDSDPHLPYRPLEVRPAAHPAKLHTLLIKESKDAK